MNSCGEHQDKIYQDQNITITIDFIIYLFIHLYIYLYIVIYLCFIGVGGNPGRCITLERWVLGTSHTEDNHTYWQLRVSKPNQSTWRKLMQGLSHAGIGIGNLLSPLCHPHLLTHEFFINFVVFKTTITMTTEQLYLLRKAKQCDWKFCKKHRTQFFVLRMLFSSILNTQIHQLQ